MRTTRVHQWAHTQRWIGPVVMEDKTGWHTMEAANRSRIRGTEEVLTTMDHPWVGVVRVVPKADKIRSSIAGIVSWLRHGAQSQLDEDEHLEAEWGVVCGFLGIQPHDESQGVILNFRKAGTTGVVETGEDTPHPIEDIEDIHLSHVGQKGIMRNILHVPTITKNLVSIGQIVDQDMQVSSWVLHLYFSTWTQYTISSSWWKLNFSTWTRKIVSSSCWNIFNMTSIHCIELM